MKINTTITDEDRQLAKAMRANPGRVAEELLKRLNTTCFNNTTFINLSLDACPSLSEEQKLGVEAWVAERFEGWANAHLAPALRCMAAKHIKTKKTKTPKGIP